MTAEIEFYRRPHGGGIRPDLSKISHESAEALTPGGRYWLVAKRLANNPKAGGTLVELGAGGGGVLQLLSGNHSYDRIVGIDIAITAPVITNGIELRNDNLNERWPFDDGSIDHLIAMMVFEHLFDPFHCFEEVRRTLKLDGTAFVNVPLITNFKNRLRLLAGIVPQTSVGYQRWFDDRVWDGNHLHYFSVDSLHRLAAACGLRIDEMQGVGSGYKLKTAFPSLLAGEITIALKRK